MVKIFQVEGMSCAACAVSVESMLASQPGVKTAVLNYASATVKVDFDNQKTGFDALKKSVQSIGYDLTEDLPATATELEVAEELKLKISRRKTFSAIALSVPIFILAMVFHHNSILNYVMLTLTLPVIFWSGKAFYMNAWKRAKHLTANMDTLVAIGTGAAFLFSVFNTFSLPSLCGKDCSLMSIMKPQL